MATKPPTSHVPPINSGPLFRRCRRTQGAAARQRSATDFAVPHGIVCTNKFLVGGFNPNIVGNKKQENLYLLRLQLFHFLENFEATKRTTFWNHARDFYMWDFPPHGSFFRVAMSGCSPKKHGSRTCHMDQNFERRSLFWSPWLSAISAPKLHWKRAPSKKTNGFTFGVCQWRTKMQFYSSSDQHGRIRFFSLVCGLQLCTGRLLQHDVACRKMTNMLSRMLKQFWLLSHT